MLLNHLRQRRSIRKFTQTPVPPQLVEKLKETALRVPSSRGKQPWQFIFVDDAELLQKISKAKMHGSAFLDKAPLAIIVLADTEISDVWIEDASIASISLQYEAEALGLGSCWVQIRNRKHSTETGSEEFLKETFQIPANYSIVAIIGAGYPEEQKTPHPASDLQSQKIHSNQFQ